MLEGLRRADYFGAPSAPVVTVMALNFVALMPELPVAFEGDMVYSDLAFNTNFLFL